MRNENSAEQIHLAARLYYVDRLDQSTIARMVNVSQAKVSRLLGLARERGIVRISVADYQARDQRLEAELCERTGLQQVAAVRVLPDTPAAEARGTVGHFGAEFVSSLLRRESVVAIAGGRTIRELVHSLRPAKDLGLTAIQAMGSIDSMTGPVDALELGRTLAERFGGHCLSLSTPAFVPDRRTRDAFLALPQVKSIFERLEEADLALVGVGTLENSVFVERGVLTPAHIARLQAAGAVGEICGRFFDRQGEECDSPLRNRVISMSFAQMRKVPQVIGVVAGGDRSEAILAAVRGGLLKSLVIDAAGGASLLAALPSEGRISSPKRAKSRR